MTSHKFVRSSSPTKDLAGRNAKCHSEMTFNKASDNDSLRALGGDEDTAVIFAGIMYAGNQLSLRLQHNQAPYASLFTLINATR